MPRYIDADAFDADCRKRYCTDCNNYNGVKCRACWVDDMLGDVDDAPTVSPDEVRGAGMWRSKTMTVPGGHGQTYNRWGCSKCKARFKTRTNYCPSCGAKMEVDGDA